MTGRTNYTQLNNGLPPEGPNQMNGIFAHFDPLIGETAATAAALPSSNNWTGRTVFVQADTTTRVWNGSAWVAIATAGGIYGIARRTTTTLSTPNAAYGDISTSAAWSAELKGGVTYSNGFTVPLAGLYELEWSALSLSGTGIMGITANGAVPAGELLYAPGAIVAAGAPIGNGKAVGRFSAGATFKLWGYGQGAVMTLTAIADHPATHWAVRWVGP